MIDPRSVTSALPLCIIHVAGALAVNMAVLLIATASFSGQHCRIALVTPYFPAYRSRVETMWALGSGLLVPLHD